MTSDLLRVTQAGNEVEMGSGRPASFKTQQIHPHSRARTLPLECACSHIHARFLTGRCRCQEQGRVRDSGPCLAMAGEVALTAGQPGRNVALSSWSAAWAVESLSPHP